jgi:hypothetical protein
MKRRGQRREGLRLSLPVATSSRRRHKGTDSPHAPAGDLRDCGEAIAIGEGKIRGAAVSKGQRR